MQYKNVHKCFKIFTVKTYFWNWNFLTEPQSPRAVKMQECNEDGERRTRGVKDLLPERSAGTERERQREPEGRLLRITADYQLDRFMCLRDKSLSSVQWKNNKTTSALCSKLVGISIHLLKMKLTWSFLKIMSPPLSVCGLVCMFNRRITQNQQSWFPWNLVEGCGIGSGKNP